MKSVIIIQAFFSVCTWNQRLLLANGHLPRVSCQSHLWDNDESGQVKPGPVHRSPGIYLTAEENPEIIQLGDRLMKTMRPATASNGVPYPK